MSKQPDYIGKIRTQIRLFWVWLLLMILVPTFAWFWPWLPEGESAASFFQRSGSALLAIGLLAELAAVRVYSILNPSVIAASSIVEAKELYGKYPARMTYAVLLAVAIGTLISGYGDFLKGTDSEMESSIFHDKEGAGMFGTVISGVMVFVFGQIVLKFIIEPIHEIKEEIGLLENTFLKNSTSKSGFSVDDNVASDFKNHCAMILTARRKVPFYNALHKVCSFPSNQDIDLGVAALRSAILVLESDHEAMKAKGEQEKTLDKDEKLTPLFQQAGESLGVNVTYSKLMDRVIKDE